MFILLIINTDHTPRVVVLTVNFIHTKSLNHRYVLNHLNNESPATAHRAMVKQTELRQHVSVWRRIVESKLYFLNDNPDRPRQFCKLAVH